MMAHAQKTDFVFRRNGRIHLNWASVQSTTGSRGVRISGSNAGYIVFRGSVKSTGYTLHLPVSPSLPLPCVTVPSHFNWTLFIVQEARWGPGPVWMGVDYLAPTDIRSQTAQPVTTTLPRANFRHCFYLKNADWNNNKETFFMKELLNVCKIKMKPRIKKDLHYITPENFLIFSLFYLLLIFKIYRWLERTVTFFGRLRIVTIG
jgi:hypothetical protein